MKMQQAHSIKVKKTARVFTLGEINSNTKHIWIILHGYSQLAEYFSRHFSIVKNEFNFFIAPEALSRYYTNESSGRVGASWMTKEDRESEIEDYINYLDEVLKSFPIPLNVKIHVLGFSQGAATASRWCLNTSYPISTLVSWSGFFPPDMKWSSEKYLRNSFQSYLVYGNDDEYLNEGIIQKLNDLLNSLVKKPIIINFDGKHELEFETMKRLFSTIENE